MTFDEANRALYCIDADVDGLPDAIDAFAVLRFDSLCYNCDHIRCCNMGANNIRFCRFYKKGERQWT